MTAAHLAAGSGIAWVLKRLLARCPQAALAMTEGPGNDGGATPLHFAALSGLPGAAACAAIICKACPDAVRLCGVSGMTALHLAATSGDEALVKVLLSAGASPADGGSGNRALSTPLHLAAAAGSPACVAALIEAGANVHAQDVEVRRLACCGPHPPSLRSDSIQTVVLPARTVVPCSLRRSSSLRVGCLRV